MSEQKYTRVDELKSAIENIPTETRQDAMMIGNVLLKLDMATAYTPAEIMAGQWVPVTERLPEDGEICLLYKAGFGIGLFQY